MAEKSRETYTRARRPIVAGVAVVAMVARQGETYNVLGDHGCRGCCCCEKLRDLYVYWESY